MGSRDAEDRMNGDNGNAAKVIDVTDDGAEIEARAAVENAAAMTIAVTCDKLSGAGVPRSVIGSIAVLIGVDSLLCAGIPADKIHQLVRDTEETFGARAKASAEAQRKAEEANEALAKQTAEAAAVRRAAEATDEATDEGPGA